MEEVRPCLGHGGVLGDEVGGLPAAADVDRDRCHPSQQVEVAGVVGGILLGVVESLAVGVNWGPFTSAYKDAIAIIVLLLVLLLRSGRLAVEERTD